MSNPFQTFVDNDYARSILEGTFISEAPEDVTAMRNTLAAMRAGIETLRKAYDERLSDAQALGQLQDVAHIRKPKATKKSVDTSVLEMFSA